MRKDQEVPHYTVAAGLVWDRFSFARPHLLITQRMYDDVHGGLWEFPGGKKQPGESLRDCLKRELQEELAITVGVAELFDTLQHTYDNFSISLHTFHCSILRGEPRAISCEKLRWVSVADLSNYEFPEADRKLIARLQKESFIPK